MLRPLKFAARFAPWFAATALVCATAALSPDAARAQTAGNLKCNKCVGTKDIAKKAVTKSRIKNNAVTFGKLNPKVEDAIKQNQAFHAKLDSSGAVATLVNHGSLRIFARCILNDLGNDRIEIVYTSTVNGWFPIISGGPQTAQSAGAEVISPFAGISGPTGTTRTGLFFVEAGAIAPDGSTIGIGPKFGLGLNVFGHRCVVDGSAVAFTGNP